MRSRCVAIACREATQAGCWSAACAMPCGNNKLQCLAAVFLPVTASCCLAAGVLADAALPLNPSVPYTDAHAEWPAAAPPVGRGGRLHLQLAEGARQRGMRASPAGLRAAGRVRADAQCVVLPSTRAARSRHMLMTHADCCPPAQAGAPHGPGASSATAAATSDLPAPAANQCSNHPAVAQLQSAMCRNPTSFFSAPVCAPPAEGQLTPAAPALAGLPSAAQHLCCRTCMQARSLRYSFRPPHQPGCPTSASSAHAWHASACLLAM